MQSELAFIADAIAVGDDGRLSVVGLFGPSHEVPGLPLGKPQIDFAALINVPPEEYGKEFDIEFRVLNPTGESVVEPMRDKLPTPGGRSWTSASAYVLKRIDFIVFRSEGQHQFQMLANGEVVAEVGLFVFVKGSNAIRTQVEEGKGGDQGGRRSS